MRSHHCNGVTKKTNAALASKENDYSSTNKTGPCILLQTMDSEVSNVLIGNIQHGLFHAARACGTREHLQKAKCFEGFLNASRFWSMINYGTPR